MLLKKQRPLLVGQGMLLKKQRRLQSELGMMLPSRAGFAIPSCLKASSLDEMQWNRGFGAMMPPVMG